MITAIRNAWIVTQDASRRIIRGDVVIDGERIVSVGPEYNGTADREIDATGDIVMPGMVNTHTHVAMSVMKGVVDDLTFPDFLDKVFKIDSDRTDEDLDVGTKLGCMEMMLSGTTTFMDLYYSEDVIAKATQQAGIRGVLCWCVLDQECTTQVGNPLQNCKNFYSRFKDERKIVPGVGLQGVYVCNEETCVGAKEFSDEVGAPMNFHLSETRGEVNDHKCAIYGAHHRLGVVDHHIEGDRQGGFIAVHHIGGRVAHQDHINTGGIDDLGHRIVVGGEHGNLLTRLFHLRQGGRGHRAYFTFN